MEKNIFLVKKTIISKNLEKSEKPGKPVIKPEKPACQVFANPGFVISII
jgi:hypothetical protein